MKLTIGALFLVLQIWLLHVSEKNSPVTTWSQAVCATSTGYQALETMLVRLFVPNNVVVKRSDGPDFSVYTVRGPGEAVLEIGEGPLWGSWVPPAPLEEGMS